MKNTTSSIRNYTKPLSEEISPLIEEFAALSRDNLSYLKTLHKPVMGWVSTYTPEEIIYAAGIIPFRITGERGVSSIASRAVLSSNICPYTLSCLEEGLQGRHDFMKGIVLVNACDARRRLYDAWGMYIDTPFVYMIDLPKIITPESKSYFTNQLIQFKETIEAQFRRKISKKSLEEAINLWNESRYLLHQLYDLRKLESPPITGSEAMTIIKASTTGDKGVFNDKLYRLLRVIEKRSENSGERRGRILIAGSYFDQLSLIKLVEELGAVVVCEDMSNGVKYFEGNVDTDKEPIKAVAEYYLGKTTSARMVDSETRFEHTLELIKDYRIDAVIYFSLKFCDNNLMDFPYQKDRLDQQGIPVLFLEGERTLVNLNQIRTRLQAFFEINGIS